MRVPGVLIGDRFVDTPHTDEECVGEYERAFTAGQVNQIIP